MLSLDRIGGIKVGKRQMNARNLVCADRIRSVAVRTVFASAMVIAVVLATAGARADEEAAKPADAAPAAWADTLKTYAQLDAGVSGDPRAQAEGRNFGHLFDDRSNAFQLNQLLLTATRPTDPAATDYDWGFKLQAMYGSDARYVRAPHEFSEVLPGDDNQVALVEANLLIHTPWLSDGGVDLKIGRASTPIGFEVIDGSANTFFSKSYIFNFGIPLETTGLLATWHMSPLIDIYLGPDTGVNTGFDHGLRHAGNGAPPALNAGMGFNMLDGNLTLLALSHIGSEFPNAAVTNGLLPPGTNVKGSGRALNDAVLTWKASDTLTLVTEANWIYDPIAATGNPANGYGVAQYVTRTLNDTISLSGRAEVFRDANGAFVGQFGNNVDFLRGEEGLPALSPNTKFPGPATYTEFTVGTTYKPAEVKFLSSVMVRAEVRLDAAVAGGVNPYNGHSSMITGALDFVLSY